MRRLSLVLAVLAVVPDERGGGLRARAALVVALAVAAGLAGCAKPAAEVEPADDAVTEAGVTVVARPDAPAAGENATASAGATADAASPGGLVPRPIRFAAPVALPIVDGIGGGEPNIAALGDGTLFVTSPSGLQMRPNANQGAAYLWRSTDGGESWETLREPMASPIGLGGFCSCDADVIASPDGWVYFTDWWNANYLVEASDDGGDLWSFAPATTREAVLLTKVDRQWLVAGEDGFVGLFYAHFAPVVSEIGPTDVNTGIHAVFSNDHGATWSDPVIVVNRPQGHSLQIGHPRMTPTGAIVMPYGDTTIADGEATWRSPAEVRLAISDDHGATWRSTTVAAAPEGFDNLWAVQGDVTADGAIHVGWAARVSDDIMASYIATSRDGGETWTAPLALRSEGLNFLPWVATYGNSTIAMGWYGGDATGDPVEADAPWYAYVAESRDGGQTFTVHRVSDEPVMDGALCPRGAACGEGRELLDYVSLVYDATGRLHYAYARSDGGIAQTLVASALPELIA